MIPIIVTHDTLYKIMKDRKFDVLCDYLINQSTIELIAPSNVYKELKKCYELYGSRQVLRRGAPPTAEQQQLMNKLKTIIKLVNISDPDGKYVKYMRMALYIMLYEKVKAFGIWYDFYFKDTYVAQVDIVSTESIPYLPTSEILRFLGKERDFLLSDKLLW